MFKEAEVLPRRLPNFGKVDNFVYLTIKLSSFTPVVLLKIATANDFFFLRPRSSVPLAIYFDVSRLCILSCDKFKPTLLALYQ